MAHKHETICLRISDYQQRRINDLWAQSVRHRNLPGADIRRFPETRSQLIRAILEEGLDVLDPIVIPDFKDYPQCLDLIPKPLLTSDDPDSDSSEPPPSTHSPRTSFPNV